MPANRIQHLLRPVDFRISSITLIVFFRSLQGRPLGHWSHWLACRRRGRVQVFGISMVSTRPGGVGPQPGSFWLLCGFNMRPCERSATCSLAELEMLDDLDRLRSSCTFYFFCLTGGGRRRWEDPNTGGSMKTSESQALGQAGFGLVSIQKRGFCGIPVDVLQPGLLVKVNERDDTSS